MSTLTEWFAFLDQPWGTAILAAAILLLAWPVGRLLSALVVRLFKRTRLDERLAALWEQADAARIDLRLRQIVRLLILLLAAWIAWGVLRGNAEIAAWLDTAFVAVAGVLGLPVVVYTLDVLMVAGLTWLLVRAIRWRRAASLRVDDRIESERGRRLRSITIQKVQLITAQRLAAILKLVARYLGLVVDLLLVLVYLTVLFSIFPQTRGLVNTLLTGVFDALSRGWQSFVDYLPSLINLIVIALVTHFGLRLVRFLFGEVGKGTIVLPNFDTDWAQPTYQLVRVLIIALALVVAFPYIPGSDSPAFQGISIFIGFLVSLGSSSFVANIIAGVVLTYTRAFRLGDRVKIGETIGDVLEKSLLVTRVRTIKNVEITIPNSIVLSSHIVNYSSNSQKNMGLILHSTVTLGYDVPWREVHQALIQAALNTPDILAEPRPFVLQTSLDDYYVSYEINAYTNTPHRMAVIYSDLHQNIQDACNAAGIEILSPAYNALRDGNHSTIPGEHLPPDYRPPGFRIDRDKPE